jgi:hypothetical protein
VPSFQSGLRTKGLDLDALARLAVERSDMAELLDAADASAAAALTCSTTTSTGSTPPR